MRRDCEHEDLTERFDAIEQHQELRYYGDLVLGALDRPGWGDRVEFIK